jgi:hypothetical protein
MFVDLHLHTTYSDGSYTPDELVKKAKNLGYSAIAITDHDTIAGIKKSLKAGRKHNLEVIPGVEFNTLLDKTEVHILGYFIDYQNKELLNLLKKIRKERRERIEKMIDLLKELYNFNISLDEIKEICANNILGRGHIARLLTKKGYVRSWEKVFDKYIGNGQPAYVSRNKITPFEANDIIKKANGIPVIAHPGLIEDDNTVHQIINYGIEGLEVYYLEHTKKQIENYKNLAKVNSLLITGGSDCHGPKNKEGLRLGKIHLDYSHLEKLKKHKTLINDKSFKKDLSS